ncbi:MAG: hypothetical protein EHM41_07090 [Chloroflexi bacterium]|nr:MAG: hypothetical protein EHM41_07090 [Chloroflexota bacterium]
MSLAGSAAREGGEQITSSPMEGKEPLLRTKLFIPPLRPNRVNRPGLIKRLNSGLDKSLILVSAPAGYGKTTLVSSWLHEIDISSAWISLDEADNDPIRFLLSFITAIQNILPTIQLKWLGAFQGVQEAPYNILLNHLINDISGRTSPFVIVLDDFHVIHAQPILEMLTFLLEHLPPHMHMVLISRTDPLLPLSRLRARDQLVEIRSEHLRFTNEEISIFMNEVMQLRVSHNDIVAMEIRTEGWIASLQLAALSMQRTLDVHSFVTAFTGSHHYIMDYLTDEVLKIQPEWMRSFLLQTSILTSMCASLCEAVVNTEGTKPIDGQVMLEALEQMNLFVIPLDERRQWYRYHHLFTDVLSLRLEHLYPDLLPELHQRASDWYEQNSMISEAIQHALKVGNLSRAVLLVEQHGCSLIMSGECFTLLKWVDAVQAYAQSHPWLAVIRAWALALTGHLDQVEATLRVAESLFSPTPTSNEVRIILGTIAALRAYMANIRGEYLLAADFAHETLGYLPSDNTFSCSIRSVATSILGDASWINGNLEDARQAYLEAVQISRDADSHYMSIIANTNLAEVLVEQGDLRQAAKIFSETLQAAARPDGLKLPVAGRIYAGLSEIFYEWNQLEIAAQYAYQCIELSRQGGNPYTLTKGFLLLARLEQARCNQEKALEAIHALEQLVSDQGLSSRQSVEMNLSAARLWLAQGNPVRAQHLIKQSGFKIDSKKGKDEITKHLGSEHLLLVHLMLAQGDYDGALTITERMLEAAEVAKRTKRVIEILVLQALAWQGKKDFPQAVEVFARALFLAHPEGYIRTFLDEGEPMAKLLFHAKSHPIGQEYAPDLLSAQGNVPGKEPPTAQLLIEPLTSRELEVLKLIESGFTNQDIADRLVISIPTVKRHISNIYAKLGAKSRTQAVSLGKGLKLFE